MTGRPGRRMVVAAAGYGKTTALRGMHPLGRAHWVRPGADLHEAVRRAVAEHEAPLVLDDVPPLSEAELRALLALFDEVEAEVVLSSRRPLPWRSVGGPVRWAELGPVDLACTVDDVAELLAEECATGDPDVAARVHDATAGWPALVHLAVEAVRSQGDEVAATPQRLATGPLARYVRDQVLAGLPEPARLLLADIAGLSPVTPGLCAALGHAQADELVDLLRRTGLLVRERQALPGLPAAERIVPVVAQVVVAGLPGAAGSLAASGVGGGRSLGTSDVAEGRSLSTSDVEGPYQAAAAAAWYDEHGPAGAAAREHLRAGDHAQVARVLREHGDRIIAAGQAKLVRGLVEALPEAARDTGLRLLLGDALRTAGELEAAARVYDELAAGQPLWSAALAWRTGRVGYQRGDAHGALAAFGRADPRDGQGRDAALLAAWSAHAHLLAGETDSAVARARRAVQLASAAGDDTALATAYLSVALCLAVAGDAAGSEEHFALALPLAQRLGDVLLLTRIHTNRTYQRLQAARYAEALESARLCVAYAQVGGSSSLHAIASCNEADALAMLGRYDEAVRRYRAVIAHYQRDGSRRFAGALLGLGQLYRRRGWREQARAAYEQVVQVAAAAGNAHVLVPALAGLALAVLADDVKAAAAHVEAATGHAGPELAGPALLAAGWIARSEGATGRAGELATEAARLARAQGDPAGLADALELRAAADGDPQRVRAALREARAIWTEAGAEVESARIALLMSRLPGAGPDDRADGLLAAQRLAAADALVDRIGGHAAVDDGPQVVVRALGRFEVELVGQVVPASQWQSRKARDLLRILVGRRGRPVPRSELCELLWPDGDQQRTGHRLSVLLNIVRGVLDPAKAYGPDHHLVADQASITLNLATTSVDVEDFLAQVARGRRLVEQEALAQAEPVLLAADELYRADAFEDEPYAQWAGPLREEARAAYLAMLRMLAHTHRAGGRPGAAVGYLLRLLERDPYDERAHRSLVRTLVAGGQHGEARRAFDRYGAAMREIGVRPPDRELVLPVRRPVSARR